MIKYYSEEFPLLRGSEFSIGLDLHAIEDIELEYGRPVVVGTGVRLFLPWNEYREAQVRIRSSLGKNGIIIPNAPATIDCVPAGTQIKTPEGEVGVEEIYNNPKDIASVISYSEDELIFRENSLDSIQLVEGKNIVTLQLESGNKVTLPETKQVYTRRGWTQVKDLLPDDEILEVQ